jgi:Flp pilus assembly protein TadD
VVDLSPERARALRSLAEPQKLLFSLGLVAALALGTHARSLNGQFLTWDDNLYVTENRAVRYPTVDRLLDVLDPRSLTLRDWTPAVTLSFAAEHAVFGLDARAYHATNWALHGATSVLVTVLFLQTGAPLVLATGAGALFAIHPLQVESVAWVSARKNLLALLFSLLSLLVYMRGRTGRAYGGALALCALALMSKGTAVVVPLWLLAYRWTLGREGGRQRAWPLRSYWGLLPFLLLAIARGLWSVYAQEDVIDRTGRLGLDGRLAAMGPVLLTYVRQLFWPNDLSVHYAWPPLGLTELRVLASWAGILALFGGWAAWASRDRRVAFAGLLAIGGLAPAANLIPAPFLQADRYTHMALVGAAYLVVAGLAAIGRTGELQRRAVVVAFVSWMVLVGVPVTWARTVVWHSGCELWRDTVEKVPAHVPARNNLGMCLLERDELEGAEQEFRTALALDMGHANAWNNLGMLLVREKRTEEARDALVRAVALEPDNPTTHRNLGKAYHELGQLATSEHHLRRSLELDPGAPVTYSVLGFLVAERGRPDEAEATLRDGLAVRDTPGLRNNLAWLLIEQGRTEEGLEHARRAVDLHPEFAAAWDTLGVALARTGSREEAREAFETALDINPSLEASRKHMSEELAPL